VRDNPAKLTPPKMAFRLFFPKCRLNAERYKGAILFCFKKKQKEITTTFSLRLPTNPSVENPKPKKFLLARLDGIP
jgi:hypothetical protein